VCRQLSVVCAFSEVIVMRFCGLRWEECVQSVIRIVQSLAEQPVVRLFQQLVKVWQIRRKVAAALAASQKRVDSLAIGRGYEASPRGRRVCQPGHHDCPEDSLQADFVHAMVTQDTQSIQRLRTVADNTADVVRRRQVARAFLVCSSTQKLQF